MASLVTRVGWKIQYLGMPILRRFDPILAAQVQHFIQLKTWPNIKHPKDFNEKLHWLNLCTEHPLMPSCAEKYGVRAYAEACDCGDLLNQAYGLYNSTEEIDWEALPDQFVLKCTHGCGFNLFCLDKAVANRSEITTQLNKWLKMDFSRVLNERHYAKMPHRIVCERYLGSSTGELPWDYKVYCFNGEARLVLVVKNRELKATYGVFDTQWQRMPILIPEDDSDEEMKRPARLAEMLKCAAILSKPFSFVRVDFYEIEGKLILGEMTFTPSGCMENYTREGIQMLGDLLDLSGNHDGKGEIR